MQSLVCCGWCLILDLVGASLLMGHLGYLASHWSVPVAKKYTLAYETLTGLILFFYSIHDISKHNHRLLARDCLVTVDLVSNVCC